ncbi:MAG: DUF4433 domain-containing protein [Deltaproteobacteria bacterium]|nr:DUF4433 domain-containing protein [Deltaproteobacteria bacterium]
MSGSIPKEPKIYHIVHVDRLASIISEGNLWCDAEIARRFSEGTKIGMGTIKQRRLNELKLSSHPDLHVGDCVPFYFCPRSVMLFVISRANDKELAYRGGQGPIIHLEADLKYAVAWAEKQGLRWAFTLSNAGAYYFEDRSDLTKLDEIDWNAVQEKRDWRRCKEGKQAEFLIESRFPWELVTRIGVNSSTVCNQVNEILRSVVHKPSVQIVEDWYYKAGGSK